MNTKIEIVDNLKRKLTITVPYAEVSAKEEEHTKKFASNAKIDGFRKGKIPVSFIKKKYGKQLRYEVVSELISSSLKEVLEKEKLNPAEMPSIDEITDSAGSDLQYVANFEIFPEIELKDFKEINLKKPVAEITEQDIEDGIKSLQEEFATWSVEEREAKVGDKLIIDFVGTIDGVPFDNGEAKDFSLELGSNTFIEGFEDGLLGVKAKEQRVINVTFPKDYHAKEFANKIAKFDVTVHSVSGKTLANLDSEFAKKLNIEDGDVNKIRDKVKSNMEETLNSIVQEQLRRQVFDKLLEVNTFDVPQALIKKELETLSQDKSASKKIENSEEEAEKRIKTGLLLKKIIEKHNIQIDRDKLNEKMRGLAKMFGNNVNMDFIEKLYNGSNELSQNLKNTVLTEQAMDLVIEGATITGKASTFVEIAKRSE